MGRWDLRIYDTLLCTQRYSLVQLRRYMCKCRQSALLLQDFEPLGPRRVGVAALIARLALVFLIIQRDVMIRCPTLSGCLVIKRQRIGHW